MRGALPAVGFLPLCHAQPPVGTSPPSSLVAVWLVGPDNKVWSNLHFVERFLLRNESRSRGGPNRNMKCLQGPNSAPWGSPEADLPISFPCKPLSFQNPDLLVPNSPLPHVLEKYPEHDKHPQVCCLPCLHLVDHRPSGVEGSFSTMSESVT